MTPEQFDRAGRLFDSALELESSHREHFLNSSCADDDAVRHCVQKMLSEHGARKSFLDSPPLGRNFNVALAAGIDTDRLAAEVSADGRYQNLVKIAEGGFGIVYRAEQTAPVRRPVALKVLKLGMDTQQILSRFEAERQTLAMMNHPNIATVLDAGATAGGRPFFVMELVSGRPITEFCDEARLDTNARIELFSQVCRAIQHAHTKGIIHRDLKPSNVLVTRQDDGRPSVKVIDFGIARAVERGSAESLQLTLEGSFLGTPQYMSPEQAAGSGDIDTRTDIYALGVMLYELLVGVTPFDVSFPVPAVHAERNVPRPSARASQLVANAEQIALQRSTNQIHLAATLRGDLDWILLKCLEFDRSRRYATAEALDADLRRFLRHEPITARPPSRADAMKKFVRRNRGGVLAAALLILAIVSGLIASLIGFSQARQQRALAEARNDELRFQLYVSQIERGQRIIETDGSEKVKPLLDQTESALRGWEWQRLNWLADRSESTITAHNGVIASVDCSKDGRFYLSVSGAGNIRIWESRQLHLLGEVNLPVAGDHEPQARVVSAKISTDGKLIAVARSNGDVFFYEWPLQKSDHTQPARSIHIANAEINCVAISPDSRHIAASSSNVPTQVYAVDTGEIVRALDPRTARGVSVEYSPDGSNILTGLTDNNVIVCRANDGSITLNERGADFVVRDARYSPDGSLIASLGMDGQIHMRKVADASLVYKITAGRQNPLRIAYSPDGKLLAVTGADGIITLLNAEDGRKRQSFRGHENTIHDLAFAPDSKCLISGDDSGTLKRWSLSPGFDDVRYQHVNTLSCAAFAENGEVVFCGGIGFGAIRIDLRAKTKTYNEVMDWIRAISPTADGRRIGICGDVGAMLLNEDLKPLRKWPVSGDGGITLSSDGQRVLYTTTDKTLVVANASTGDIIRRISEKTPPRCALLTPDGRTVLTGHENGTVSVWTIDAAATERSWIAHEKEPVKFICIAAGGRHITTRAESGELRIWSWPQGELIATLPTKEISAAAISPDGTRMATAGQDLIVRLWNVARREQTMTIGRHSSGVTSLTFSNNGTLLASTGHDHILNVWRSQGGGQQTQPK